MSEEKASVGGGMSVRVYPVLCRAVEEGVVYGWQRAHKHLDAPAEHLIKDHIIAAVLNEICEYFSFEDEA